jgi:hypothetical protein
MDEVVEVDGSAVPLVRLMAIDPQMKVEPDIYRHTATS